MNNVGLILTAQANTTLRLTPDWFVLSDAAAYAAVSQDAHPAYPDRTKVFIDHETPCGSEIVAGQQRKLIDFAVGNACELFNGYGTNYQLMLNRYVRSGQLIAHCGDFGSIYASAGACAIKLTPEQMREALISGTVEFTVPESVSLCVSGELRDGACGKDAALAALKTLDCRGKLLNVSGSGIDNLPGTDRNAFFQLLSASGCVCAIAGDTASNSNFALNLDDVAPMVSRADDFSAAAPAADCGNISVSAVFIGGCSTGRIEDIRAAAGVARGRHVNRKVRAILSFATSSVYIQAANEGLIETLLDAGVLVMNQGCSACYGHSQGLADSKDVVLSAGSRPMPDCCGKGSVVTYLCSAATAMESAIAGHICAAERRA